MIPALPPRLPFTPMPPPVRTLALESPESVQLDGAQARAQLRYGKIPGVQISVVEVGGSSKPVVVLRNALSHGKPSVQVHFHGDQYLDAQVGYDQHIGPTIGASWKNHPDLVFVIPESNNEDSGQRVDWSNVSNVGQMSREALKAAGVDPDQVGSRILSGHSAGGSVIARAIAADSPAPGYELKDFDRIELYDAAVGSTLNPISAAERDKVQQWTQSHEDRCLYVPGVIKSSAWKTYIDPSRWTKPETDHFTALWDSLGQLRQPGS
jgi:hypothetical protein